MMKIENNGLGIEYSLHNHSDFSDGANTLEEVCRRGKEAGLKCVGISDHWCEPPFDGTDWADWCMAHERLDEYVEKVLELKKRYNDDNFNFLLGLEVDYFEENFAETCKRLEQYPFDYLIGSVHYTGVFSVDHDIADWVGLSEAEIDNICEKYWKKLAQAADTGYFTFIGHLDLPKKFGMIDEKKYFRHALNVLDILQKRGGALEINTAGWFKKCAAPYPSAEIIREAKKRHIPMVISADSHHVDHLTRNFAEASELAAL